MKPFRRVKDRLKGPLHSRAIAGFMLQAPGGGGEYVSMSNIFFHEMNTCTNTPKGGLFNAQKTTENGCRVLMQLQVVCCRHQAPGGGINLCP